MVMAGTLRRPMYIPLSFLFTTTTRVNIFIETGVKYYNPQLFHCILRTGITALS
jgi:hypothetical protein